MVPHLKRRKEEGSGSVVSLFPCRKTSTSTSIQQLSDDMLFEIFCRLPCESAAKCKSVSKHWLSLISHLYFIPGYICHHHQTNGNATQPFTLLLESFGNIVVVLSEMDKKVGVKVVDLLKFLPPASELHIEAAFSDLLLVCSNDSRFWLKNTSVFDYYICNPYTKYWLTLPQLPPMTFASTPLVGFICDANLDISWYAFIVHLNLHQPIIILQCYGWRYFLPRQVNGAPHLLRHHRNWITSHSRLCSTLLLPAMGCCIGLI